MRKVLKRSMIISDVDGILSTGQFLYNAKGKQYKVFGPHDADGLKLLNGAGFQVAFISADKRGFDITKKRIDDMGSTIFSVSENDRVNFLWNALCDCNDLDQNLWFIGDGFFDASTVRAVRHHPRFSGAITHKQAVKQMRDVSKVISGTPGNGFFYEAALYILKKEKQTAYVNNMLKGTEYQ